MHILFQVKDVPQKIWNLCGTPKLHFNQVVQWEFFSKFLVWCIRKKSKILCNRNVCTDIQGREVVAFECNGSVIFT